MATFKPMKAPDPIEISVFKGINESVGETEIEPNEFVYMRNFRITKNYKLQKRPGHQTLIDFNNNSNVQGVWTGKLGNDNIMIVLNDGKVYEYDMDIDTDTTLITELISEGTVTQIGTITDIKTSVFFFIDKIYFLNGTDYKEYDGSTYQDVVPYVPTMSINALPDGSNATAFEELNLLTSSRKETFIGDGTSKNFKFVTTTDYEEISMESVTVNGETVSWSRSATDDNFFTTVDGTNAPPVDSEVIVTYSLDNIDNEDLVKGHKYTIDFGVGNDTNLFIFGSDSEKNKFRYSYLNMANYFPANSFTTVGNNDFAITSLKPQYQNLIVSKENRTMIVKPEVNTNFATNAALQPYNFPYFDLNEGVGNIAPNQGRLVENRLVTLYGFSMWAWASNTNVEDERNAQIISDRLKLSLETLNLKNAVTYDYQKQKEYWVNVDDLVYIWNYGNDTMYIYEGFDASEYFDVDGVLHYCSKTGTVEIVDQDYLADGEELGTDISCIAKSGFADFGMLERRKIMRYEWLAINPSNRTSVDLYFLTDRKTEDDANLKTKTVEYKLLNFDDIDFNDFSFLTNVNPQPFRIKLKERKFTYIQTVFKHESNNEDLTVLKLLLKCKVQGYSK